MNPFIGRRREIPESRVGSLVCSADVGGMHNAWTSILFVEKMD